MKFIVLTEMPPNEVRGRHPGMKIDRLIGILSVLLQEKKPRHRSWRNGLRYRESLAPKIETIQDAIGLRKIIRF